MDICCFGRNKMLVQGLGQSPSEATANLFHIQPYRVNSLHPSTMKSDDNKLRILTFLRVTQFIVAASVVALDLVNGEFKAGLGFLKDNEHPFMTLTLAIHVFAVIAAGILHLLGCCYLPIGNLRRTVNMVLDAVLLAIIGTTSVTKFALYNEYFKKQCLAKDPRWTTTQCKLMPVSSYTGKSSVRFKR